MQTLKAFSQPDNQNMLYIMWQQSSTVKVKFYVFWNIAPKVNETEQYFIVQLYAKQAGIPTKLFILK